MKIFDFLKKKEPARLQVSREQKITMRLAITSHKKRIENLGEEYKRLTKELGELELDVELTRNERQKLSDTKIRRMSLIRHEIEIREGQIKWLS